MLLVYKHQSSASLFQVVFPLFLHEHITPVTYESQQNTLVVQLSRHTLPSDLMNSP